MKKIKIRWRGLLLGVGLFVVIVYMVNRIPTRPGMGEPLVDGNGLSETSPAPPPTAAPSQQPGPSPTETPPPFRFTFPTQRAAPVSAWRPPLYPVPWAPTSHDHFYFIRPIAADEKSWPDPNYRYGGVFFEGVTHSGVDIPATEGAPVLAAGPGKVVWAGYGLYSGPTAPDDPYGLAVVIRHDFGYQGQQLFTLYAHLSRVDVIRGQYLQTSEPLGLVGDTGFTTGAHLHFEIRKGENYLYATLNPELWIAPPQGWGVLAARVTSTGRRQLYNFPVTVRNLDTGQTWKVITYGSEIDVNSDPYYEENMVIGDLPAGNYQIEITYLGRTIQWDIQIHPGQVSYFTFRGRNGFFGGPPPTPEADFTPLP